MIGRVSTDNSSLSAADTSLGMEKVEFVEDDVPHPFVHLTRDSDGTLVDLPRRLP